MTSFISWKLKYSTFKIKATAYKSKIQNNVSLNKSHTRDLNTYEVSL